MSDPTDQPQDLASENAKLKEENARLTKKVKSLKDTNASWWNIRFFIGKKIGEVFLGWRLSGSIKQLVREIKEKNVQNETIGDVLTHILWRFTRIGLFAVLLAIIPSAILIVQTKLLSNQNKLLTYQNERIEQQNHLIEAQRRSSYLDLVQSTTNDIKQELSEPNNTSRKLSSTLIAEIIALSNALLPYKILINDSISATALSPERGILFQFILDINIAESDLCKILFEGNFEQSYFDKLRIVGDTLPIVSLNGSRVENLEVRNSWIQLFACNDCHFNLASFSRSKFNRLYLSSGSEFELLLLKSIISRDIDLSFASASYVQIDSCTIYNFYIQSKRLNVLAFENNPLIEYAQIDAQSFNQFRIYNSKLSFIKLNSKRSWATAIPGTGEYLLFKHTKIQSFSLYKSHIRDFECNASTEYGKISKSIILNIDDTILNKEGTLFDHPNVEIESSIISGTLLNKGKTKGVQDTTLNNVKYYMYKPESVGWDSAFYKIALDHELFKFDTIYKSRWTYSELDYTNINTAIFGEELKYYSNDRYMLSDSPCK